MCGIIGAVSYRDISQVLIQGLKKLEYRGYDSAGIALITAKGQLKRVRVQGKVNALAEVVQEAAIHGLTGIAHTRWATHGKPCELNAHPHLSQGQLAVVHNGIIENHESLRQELKEAGYEFSSETDTEVAAHLINQHYHQSHNLLQAVQSAAKIMQGSFALAVISKESAHELVAVRKGSPLLVGLGQDELFIASDSLALSPVAKSILYLEEGDCVRLSMTGIEIFDETGKKVYRESYLADEEKQAVDKGPYRHFMLKEIFEQPKVLAETLKDRIDSMEALKASFPPAALALFPEVRQIHIIACGTSYHAGLIAKYWLESLAGIPTQVEIASEYRYRDIVVPEKTLFICVSQSGETADTLAALTKAKASHYLGTLAICNVATSTMVREAGAVFLTKAGAEIGVASTKAFVTQLASFLMLAALLAKDDKGIEVLRQLQELPQVIQQALKMDGQIEALATFFVPKVHTLFLGRGVQYPVALEGALKLKEISYIHAEAYPAGELKHGPLALVDSDMPVIAIAPNDELLEKLKSNLHEVNARGGQLIVFVDGAKTWVSNGTKLISVPSCGSWIAPIVYTIPLQLLAYHVAVAKGTDVDQPRNLAKSVTVE